MIFFGIDIRNQPVPYTYLALDATNQPVASGKCDRDDLLAVIASFEPVRVAINAPLNLNIGLLRRGGKKKSFPGRYPNMRAIEYAFAQHDIPIYHTPDEMRKCHLFMKLGIRLGRILTQQDFKRFPVEDTPKQFMEVPADVAYWALSSADIVDETNLIGRLQRQLILYDLYLPVKNPMNFFEEVTRYRLKHGLIPEEPVLSTEELNAWITAYTALLTVRTPEKIKILGNTEEGEIVLPTLPEHEKISDPTFQQSFFE